MMDKEGALCLDARWERALDIVLYVLSAFGIIAGIFSFGLILIDDPGLTFGRMKFSMEPVVHTGLDVGDHGPGTSPPPPEFNVTLHARNTHKHRYCGQGATVRVVYADVVIAIARMDPFCVEPKGGTAVLAATASPGWPALPPEFRERIENDRRSGGAAQVEVDVKFYHEVQGSMWVRCRTALDAKEACRCKLFGFY